jgi:plastocyanin
MQRRFGAFVVVCAWLAIPATAAAASKTVYAGGPAKFQGTLQKKYGAGVDGFTINKVTINVGDTIVWNGKALAGGFHTVDFPKNGGAARPLITPTGKILSGVLDAVGNPFWFNGKLPQLGFNPVLFAPSGPKTYNGSAAVESGLPLGKPKDLKLKFSKAGTYKYFCNVHPGMVGVVVVKPKGKTVPTATQDAATLAKEEAAFVKTAKQVDKTKPIGNNVSVGASGPGGLEVFSMFPGKLTVKSGTTVTFAMSKLTREVHTASFGPTAYLNALATAFTQPVFAGNAVYPSDPPGTITLNPTSHGNGFASTGAMDRVASTPLPPSGQIQFTAPGTYNYICLVHPFMHGQVVVTP